MRLVSFCRPLQALLQFLFHDIASLEQCPLVQEVAALLQVAQTPMPAVTHLFPEDRGGHARSVHWCRGALIRVEDVS